MLTIEQLYFSYGYTPLLDNVSLKIEENTTNALIGENGAGKSTLMNCITHLLVPSAGDIKINNHSITANPNQARRLMGYLPDNFGLFDNLTVYQHLQFAANTYHCPKNAINQVIKDVRLNHLLNEYPAKLSRGQRQQIGIAMAIIHRPPLILLDEPTSGLDPLARKDLSQLVKRLQDEGHTLIISSHVLTELREYASHCIVIGEGAIKQHRPLKQTKLWQVRWQPKNNDDTNLITHELDNLAKVVSLHSDDYRMIIEILSLENNDSIATKILKRLIIANIDVVEFTKLDSDIEVIYRQSL